MQRIKDTLKKCGWIIDNSNDYIEAILSLLSPNSNITMKFEKDDLYLSITYNNITERKVIENFRKESLSIDDMIALTDYFKRINEVAIKVRQKNKFMVKELIPIRDERIAFSHLNLTIFDVMKILIRVLTDNCNLEAILKYPELMIIPNKKELYFYGQYANLKITTFGISARFEYYTPIEGTDVVRYDISELADKLNEYIMKIKKVDESYRYGSVKC